MPIRSPRRLYEITTITRNIDDLPQVIDNPTDEAPNNTDESLFVKMKEAIGEYLGLTPIEWNDPRYLGIFRLEGDDPGGADAQTGTTNTGATYHRNIGGFRAASYKFLPVTRFTLNEDFYDRASDNRIRAPKNFQSFNIGFPVGTKVWQVKYWIAAQDNFDNIRAMVTPRGKTVDLYS